MEEEAAATALHQQVEQVVIDLQTHVADLQQYIVMAKQALLKKSAEFQDMQAGAEFQDMQAGVVSAAEQHVDLGLHFCDSAHKHCEETTLWLNNVEHALLADLI